MAGTFDRYVRPDDPPSCGNCRHWRAHTDASAGLCVHPNNRLGWKLTSQIYSGDGPERCIEGVELEERNPLPLITLDRAICTQHERN